MMSAERVCCVLTHLNYSKKREVQRVSCNGLFLSSTIVLSPGCLLNTHTGSIEKLTNNVGTLKQDKFLVTVETESSLLETEATIIYIWQCKEFEPLLRKVFANGVKALPNDGINNKVDILSYFILLRLSEPVPLVMGLLSPGNKLAHIDTGQKVLLCSTPFGDTYMESFINSWCSGIVSSLLGGTGELFLCDVRCTPGCQGGLIYQLTDKVKYPSGMVIHPVVWRNDEPSGMAICGSLQTILQSLLNTLDTESLEICYLEETERLKSLLHALQSYDNLCSEKFCVDLPLVKVLVEDTWGSGILISESYVLTCAHVIGAHNHSRIIIKFDNESFTCEVVYVSSNPTLFDVAVLKLLSFKSLKVAKLKISTMLSVQQSVKAYGFGVLKHSQQPVVTIGTVSKVSRLNVITSCYVHSGSSGGILATENGVVAMITANTLDATNNVVYSNISHALPMTLLKPAIDTLNTTNSLQGFKDAEQDALNHIISFPKVKSML